jgi:hypothetical protein
MNCRRARALIYDVSDNAIADGDRIALEQHLVGCASCDALAKGWSASLALLRRAPVAQPDENFNWKVRLAVAQARKDLSAGGSSERTWARSWNVRFAFSALSTFVVVAATGYALTRADMFGRGDRNASDRRAAVDASIAQPAGDPGRHDDAASSSVMDASRVNPALVSTGPQGQPMGPVDETGLIDEVGPALNTDSLTNYFLKARVDQYRMRLLEQQLETLLGELRKCETEEK